ncbi:transposase [Streptomyces sp. NPDC085927]|uniref:transposase n=1 Tax=Streptomyces sp. NPDC085927 TaxID=3365738 RepID=UPI0037D3C922
MIRRHELSDAEWDFVRPLLSAPSRGRKRLDDRTVLNGVLWKFRTGVAWWPGETCPSGTAPGSPRTRDSAVGRRTAPSPA